MNVELHENGPLAITASLHHIPSDPGAPARRYADITIIDVKGSIHVYSMAGGAQNFANKLFVAATQLQEAITKAEENQH